MLIKWTIVLEGIFFCAATGLAARANGIMRLLVELLFWPFVITWIALLISAFLPESRKKRKIHFAVLMLLPIAAMTMVRPLGQAMKPFLFQRDLPQVQQYLTLIKNGSVHGKNVQNVEVIEPSGQDDLIPRTVWVERNQNRIVLVTFWAGYAGSMETAYVFCPQKSDIPKIEADWPRIYQRSPQWFEVEGARWSHKRFRAKQKVTRKQAT